MKTISEIMTTPVVTVSPQTTLAEAVRVLIEHHIGSLPVVASDGVVVGMISELALIDVVFDVDTRLAPVSRYMTEQVHTVRPDEPLSRAAQLFALYSFRRLPVVDDGRIAGVVSRRDLMSYALRTGETLREPLFELIPALAAFA